MWGGEAVLLGRWREVGGNQARHKVFSLKLLLPPPPIPKPSPCRQPRLLAPSLTVQHAHTNAQWRENMNTHSSCDRRDKTLLQAYSQRLVAPIGGGGIIRECAGLSTSCKPPSSTPCVQKMQGPFIDSLSKKRNYPHGWGPRSIWHQAINKH